MSEDLRQWMDGFYYMRPDGSYAIADTAADVQAAWKGMKDKDATSIPCEPIQWRVADTNAVELKFASGEIYDCRTERSV